MRALNFLAAFVLLAAAPIFAQTSAKPKTAAAGLAKPDAASNADRNIRAYIELLRADVKTSKAQIMGEVMLLDSDQATKFWPLYKEFEAEYSRLGDRIVAVVTKYADECDNMTDAIADSLGQQVLSIEGDRNDLKKKFYDRFKQSLGAIVAVRFLQVENQLERIADLQIAAGLPIAEAR
jgi:hypothetical protein